MILIVIILIIIIIIKKNNNPDASPVYETVCVNQIPCRIKVSPTGF